MFTLAKPAARDSDLRLAFLAAFVERVEVQTSAVVGRFGPPTQIPLKDRHQEAQGPDHGGSTIGFGSPISTMRAIRCCFKASATSLCDRRPARLCSS